MKQASASFCEQKEAKKLLLASPVALGIRSLNSTAPAFQKFFGSFFQKRTASF
jgi:hypothetical protein